jgi:2,4-diketo-3-deoxy-L-fuconate hydrolase
MYPRKKRRIILPAIASATTYLSAHSNSRKAVSGTRAKAATRSGPLAPGWSREMRYKTSRHVARGKWPSLPGRQYSDNGFRSGFYRELPESIHEPAARRCHLFRYATRRWSGTPPGVGLGQKPPVYLAVGDRIKLGIDGLGKQSQTVVALNR